MDLLTESVKKVGRGMGHIHYTSPCMKLLNFNENKEGTYSYGVGSLAALNRAVTQCTTKLIK